MDVVWVPDPLPCSLARGAEAVALREARLRLGVAARSATPAVAAAAAEVYATMWAERRDAACTGAVWSVPGRGVVCTFHAAAEAAMVARLRVGLLVRAAAQLEDRTARLTALAEALLLARAEVPPVAGVVELLMHAEYVEAAPPHAGAWRSIHAGALAAAARMRASADAQGAAGAEAMAADALARACEAAAEACYASAKFAEAAEFALGGRPSAKERADQLVAIARDRGIVTRAKSTGELLCALPPEVALPPIVTT